MSRHVPPVKPSYDVLIIGGGPVGSQLASRLASRGYRVAVLEQKLTLDGPVCCTGIVSEECLRAFSIDETLVFRHISAARLVSPSGKELRFQRSTAQAAVLDRAAFNAAWSRHAQAAGADIRLGTRADAITVGPDSVRVTISSDGREEHIDARAVVIAGGFSPGLTAAAGLGDCADFALGVQAEVETTADEPSIYVGSGVSPGFFGWLVPTRPGRGLAGLLCRQRPHERLDAFLAALAAAGRIASTDVPKRFGSVSLAPPGRTYSDRLIAVGTAAGQVKPITGGGLYFGLLCADIAARTLDRALGEDDLSARRLAAYQREWKRRIGRELTAGGWARRLLENLSDGQLERIIDIMRRDRLLDRLLQEDVSFDWHSGLVRHLLGNLALAKLMGVAVLPGRTPGQSAQRSSDQ